MKRNTKRFSIFLEKEREREEKDTVLIFSDSPPMLHADENLRSTITKGE